MITYSDIDKAVTDCLLDKFPDIEVTENDVKEGFNRPSFFVQLDNTRKDTRLYVVHQSLTVRIYYFPSNRHAYQSELMDVQEKLEEVFNLNLNVLDRTLTIEETNAQVIDGVLEFEFDLEFYQNVKKEDDSDLMSEIVSNL